MNQELLKANYRRVLARAADAAARAGRPVDSWRLVAVTKTVDAGTAAALVDLGAGDLGENRVPDLLAKMEALAVPQAAVRPVRWHMIGHLQRNKAKKLVGAVALIHGVDSLRLAGEIERCAAKAGAEQEILLEVNISGEESKYGLSTAEAPGLASEIANLPHVKLAGLMTMAPIVAHPDETRPLFRGLARLAREMAAAGLFARDPFELSMGMTQDFEVAIEEGATLIRVGSALFEGLEPDRSS